MKKILLTILVCFLILFYLTGCRNKYNGKGTELLQDHGDIILSIERGNEKIYLNDIFNKFGNKIDNYSKELRLIKEEAITNIEVKLSKGEFKLILDTDKQKYYLVDIERISYYKNGVECVIEDSFPSKEKDCSAELVTITKSDINKGYVILEREYYNSLSCIIGMYQDATYIDYIVPKDYKLNENSCSEMKLLHN